MLISSSDFHYTFEESSDFRYCTEVIDLHAIVLIAEDRWTTTLLSTKSQLMPYQDSSYKTKETCNIPKHSLKIQRKKIQKKLIQTRNHDRWPDWEAKCLWRNYYDGIFSWTTSSTCMSKIKVTGTFYLLLVIWYHVKGLWVKTDFSFRYILLILTKVVTLTFKGNHKYNFYLKKPEIPGRP